VISSDYAGEIASAQAIMGTAVPVRVKKINHTPSQADIASWLVINGPGKGVMVDPSGAAKFIAGIPGAFDRAGALSGLLSALNAHKALTVTPSVRRITSTPAPKSVIPALPLASFTYCIDKSAEPAEDLKTTLETALGQEGSWSLGGRIRFLFSGGGCNFNVQVATKAAMNELDPACSSHTSCRIHNDLAIAATSWAKAPENWTGGLSSYRVEMVNHVLGQWLGFDHAGCTASQAQTPVLSAPSVTLPSGCSPKWYAVPAELQDTKVLAGF
jgi:hypothetical protein